MYTIAKKTGTIIIPVEYVGGLEDLKKTHKGNLYITEATCVLFDDKGFDQLIVPTRSIRAVYIGDEIKRRLDLNPIVPLGLFGMLLGTRQAFPLPDDPLFWLAYHKEKNELLAIEFTDKDKNLMIPIFRIKVGTGQMLKKLILTKARLSIEKT